MCCMDLSFLDGGDGPRRGETAARATAQGGGAAAQRTAGRAVDVSAEPPTLTPTKSSPQPTRTPRFCGRFVLRRVPAAGGKPRSHTRACTFLESRNPTQSRCLVTLCDVTRKEADTKWLSDVRSCVQCHRHGAPAISTQMLQPLRCSIFSWQPAAQQRPLARVKSSPRQHRRSLPQPAIHPRQRHGPGAAPAAIRLFRVVESQRWPGKNGWKSRRWRSAIRRRRGRRSKQITYRWVEDDVA